MPIKSQEPDINDIYQNAQPYDIIEEPERFAEIKDDIADFREEEMVNYEPGEMELDEEERCSTYFQTLEAWGKFPYNISGNMESLSYFVCKIQNRRR